MNPLELEMYHQIKNVIGVNPTFYEYLFMVDADTTVDPYSANRLISAYVGSCGPSDHSANYLQNDPRQEVAWCLWRDGAFECKTIHHYNDAGKKR